MNIDRKASLFLQLFSHLKLFFCTLALIVIPLSGNCTQMFYPVTVTGSYSIKSDDPRVKEVLYRFEIRLEHGNYIGTIERPIVEYARKEKSTSEIITKYTEEIKGKWALRMKVIIIDFPHIHNLKKIKGESDNNFSIKFQTVD